MYPKYEFVMQGRPLRVGFRTFGWEFVGAKVYEKKFGFWREVSTPYAFDTPPLGWFFNQSPDKRYQWALEIARSWAKYRGWME